MFTEVTAARSETRNKARGYRMWAERRGRRLLATPQLGHILCSWINMLTRPHGFTDHRNCDVEITLRARKLSVAYRAMLLMLHHHCTFYRPTLPCNIAVCALVTCVVLGQLTD
jgi:hypothetical protein